MSYKKTLGIFGLTTAFLTILELIISIFPSISYISPIFWILSFMINNGYFILAREFTLIIYPSIIHNIPFIFLGIFIMRNNHVYKTKIIQIGFLNLFFHILAIVNRIFFYITITSNEFYAFYLNPIWIGMFLLQVILLFVTSSISNNESKRLKMVTYIKFIFDVFTLAILNVIFMLPYSIEASVVLAIIFLGLSILVVIYLYEVLTFASKTSVEIKITSSKSVVMS